MKRITAIVLFAVMAALLCACSAASKPEFDKDGWRVPLDSAVTLTHEFDEALLDNYIPKMLIQPLVENACVHGVWTDEGAQDAGLTITREGDSMKVVVADRGEGMTPERLEEVHRLLQNGDNSMHSVGLNNVLIRCRLYYGADARLDVESRRNGGTVFTLIVPIRWKKEDFHVSGSDCG